MNRYYYFLLLLLLAGCNPPKRDKEHPLAGTWREPDGGTFTIDADSIYHPRFGNAEYEIVDDSVILTSPYARHKMKLNFRGEDTFYLGDNPKQPMVRDN